MVSSCLGKLNSTHFGQEVQELWLELTSLVHGDDLRATEAPYPAGQYGACHTLDCEVRNRNGFWPAREAVNCSEAVCVACWRKGPHEVYVDVKVTGCWQREFSHWSNCVESLWSPGKLVPKWGNPSVCPATPNTVLYMWVLEYYVAGEWCIFDVLAM
jgi:hypothetical protein